MSRLSNPGKVVLAAGVALFTAWLVLNMGRLAGYQNGLIRFTLTLLFSILIIIRAGRNPGKPAGSSAFLPVAGILGALLAVSGLVLGVNQLEWVGLLLLLYACLGWSMPFASRRDIGLGLLLLFWAHPLPGRVFSSVQFAMQRMSVAGSEWLLHVFNVRVWADDLVLHTGLNIYGVPEWCSGMRTATTVFLLVLGIGILRRWKWYEFALGLPLGLFQALALNVIRISLMVTLTPWLGAGAGQEFLHDTVGIIVLIATALVYVEILAWQKYKARQVAREQDINAEYLKVLSEYPPMIRFVIVHRLAVITSSILLLLASFSAYKSREYHRAQMIKGAAVALRDSGRLEKALMAANQAAAMDPEDRVWELTRIRMMVIASRYEQALEDLDAYRPDGEEVAEVGIVRAYALMGLGRIREAATIVDSLPRSIKRDDPRVAMILAEMARHTDEPNEVVKHIETAGRWAPNISRIRALYPYLRAYGKWNAIAGSNVSLPYASQAQALSAVEAYMNLNDVPLVAQGALNAMKAWPKEPRVLEPLFFMALKRGGEWSERFADHLVRCIPEMTDPEDVFGVMDKCFDLLRPDLAWRLYNRIEELDPESPLLPLSAALYADRWFVFGKRDLGFSTGAVREGAHIGPLYIIGKGLSGWRELCRLVPLGEELAAHDAESAGKGFLKQFIARCSQLHETGGLSLSMQYHFVNALELAGDSSAALEHLDSIAATYPNERHEVTVIRSGIFERIRDWQNVYETLREYPSEYAKRPSIEPLLRLCEAQMNLKLGLAALNTANYAAERFPTSMRVRLQLAKATAWYDSEAEALLIVQQPRLRKLRELDYLEAYLLYETERYNEADAFCGRALMPRKPPPPNEVQATYLPPAELAVLWRYISIPSERAFRENASILSGNSPEMTSPYLVDLSRLWLDAFQKDCAGELADPDRWIKAGRDNPEKAIALNQLTLLLCRAERFQEARDVAGRAVKFLPDSPILWRILVSLSNMDPDVVDAARRRCPADSEIWLAELVADTRPGDASMSETQIVQRFGGSGGENLSRYTPEALARAADYLLRKEMLSAAHISAREANSRARGLLPVYIIAIRAAVLNGDSQMALDCTRAAIEASLKPTKDMFKSLVELKMTDSGPALDSEMVEALKYLRRGESDNPVWAQMLGFVRFQRGGWEVGDALTQMTFAMERGSKDKIVYSIAGESARLLGNIRRAENILKKGLERHPGDVDLLNNLVYTLSFDPDGLAEAERLLPELLSGHGHEPHVMDTASVVYIRAGRYEEAEEMLNKLLAAVEDQSPRWFRANMHLAELRLKQRKSEQALAGLREIMSGAKGIPDEDILYANKLIVEAESAIEEAGLNNQVTEEE